MMVSCSCRSLYFLLDPGQLLRSDFVFFHFLNPVLHLDLVKLGVALKDLYW
jgi:hypothetical protein